MRREVPKPKIRSSEIIPADLVEFLRDVDRQIADGEQSAFIESDDLLQCECAYGGLVEEGGTDYGFTYFPDIEGTRNTWELILSRDMIRRIGHGSQSQLELWACPDPSCRCRFADPAETCFYCDYEDVPD
jgi:hypothetical protein